METNFVSIFRHIIYYRVWTIYGPLTQWNVTSKKKLTQWNVNVDNQVFLQDDMNIKEANA